MSAPRRDVYREAVVKVLEEAGRPLSFPEIVERVERLVGGRVNRFLLREALAELVREGVVRKSPSYERRLMVFEVPRGKSRRDLG